MRDMPLSVYFLAASSVDAHPCAHLVIYLVIMFFVFSSHGGTLGGVDAGAVGDSGDVERIGVS